MFVVMSLEYACFQGLISSLVPLEVTASALMRKVIDAQTLYMHATDMSTVFYPEMLLFFTFPGYTRMNSENLLSLTTSASTNRPVSFTCPPTFW
jgi:hypothetical protein